MHSPSLAHGRWKLRSQLLSAQVMAAPLSPQTQHCWKEQNRPISMGASVPMLSLPPICRQSPSTPLPVGRSCAQGCCALTWLLRAGGLPLPLGHNCALIASTARVPALSAPHQTALTLGLSPAAFALLQASRVTMAAL
uniref:Uncharacterized protein n=1 Tax=Meleagris gallopavo TaxID=9103 RepID=A0A803XWM8_MELGA